MASFYERMQKTASSLLAKFGAPVTFTRRVKGEYVPGSGQHASDEEITWRANAIKTGLTKEFTGGTRLEVGDLQILVDCKGQQYIPAQGDLVTFGNGEVWGIVADMPVAPTDELTVLYKGVVRKG